MENVRSTQAENSVVVRDLGLAVTAVNLGVALAAAPIIQGTNIIVATTSDAANATISVPFAPVGTEIMFRLTGVAGGGFIIQEAGVGVQQRIAGAAAAFASRAADAAAGNAWTFTGTLTLVATAGTATLILRKVRANTNAATSDGWVLIAFYKS